MLLLPTVHRTRRKHPIRNYLPPLRKCTFALDVQDPQLVNNSGSLESPFTFRIIKMSKAFFLFVALNVILGVTSTVWSNAFIAPTSVSSRSAVMSLNMVAVIDGKQRQLDMGKEKYAGRSDLVSMIDDAEDEVDSYTLFAEADDDEAAPPKTGETITGTVIEMDDNGALLEIGGKMSGYLPLKEAALIPIKHVNTVLEIGQELTAEVIGTLKGMPVISLRTAQLIVAWANALKIRVADETFEGKVIEVNRGGVVVDAFGLKCFLPGSHYLGTADESIIGNVIKVTALDHCDNRFPFLHICLHIFALNFTI